MRALQTTPLDKPVDVLLTRRQVSERYTVSERSLDNWIAKRGFPRPLRLGGRKYWRLADLHAWEASCAV